jgi:hypothetical protein
MFLMKLLSQYLFMYILQHFYDFGFIGFQSAGISQKPDYIKIIRHDK